MSCVHLVLKRKLGNRVVGSVRGEGIHVGETNDRAAGERSCRGLDHQQMAQLGIGVVTEITRDRLVVMVTYNPELAAAYATRFNDLGDGVVLQDSNSCVPGAEGARISERASRRTSMSFLTTVALSLYFSNLMTKTGRALMMFFAGATGSIGSIGSIAILALANGVNAYIKECRGGRPLALPADHQEPGLRHELVGIGYGRPGRDGQG
ncbi:hypothetical protein QBC39DRAFT_177044 [Podospora conica]|nr:hypothetical protein QBC39DRAFT_177044 [Schizothecium conicum]